MFGSYDFSVTSDRLPEECRGGRGRDDGVPMALEDDHGKGNDNDHADDHGENTVNNNATAIAEGQENAPPNNNTSAQRRKIQTTLNTDTITYTEKANNNDTPCPKFEQCHRNFPNSKSCNIHKHQEGLIYRAHTQGAQVYPSIGGWTLSGSFPTVAADPKTRQRFAQECVGLIADYGFDGIDIDWDVSSDLLVIM